MGCQGGLTVIIGVAEDVLLDVFVLTGVMLVLEPQRNGEVTRQIVSHGLGRHHHSGRSIKQVHLADEAGGQKKKKGGKRRRRWRRRRRRNKTRESITQLDVEGPTIKCNTKHGKSDEDVNVYLIGFPALISGQVFGPLGSWSRRRQQIDGVAVGSAQLALILLRRPHIRRIKRDK